VRRRRTGDYQSHQPEIDEQLYHFCVVDDLAQPDNGNPPIPPEIEFSYALTMRKLPVVGMELLRRGSAGIG